METAAKKRSDWASGMIASMLLFASALVFGSVATTSSVDVVGPNTRAGVSGLFSSKSIELLDANPGNATRYYDRLGGIALECTVAPVRTGQGPFGYPSGTTIPSAPSKTLTHLTTKASYEAIIEGGETAGKIGGKWGIFALDASKVPQSRFWRSFNTLVPDNLTHKIDIPAGAVSAFNRPIAWGPVSAYRRWIAGVHSTPLGSIDLNAGTFLRGEIFKNGVFRPATCGEWMKYYGHQFVLDYGIDAGLYGIAGLGTAIYVGPQGITDGYNWLQGDRQ